MMDDGMINSRAQRSKLTNHKMAVLLFKEENSQDKYRTVLESRGFSVAFQTLLHFRFNTDSLKEVFPQHERFAGLICTSPRAVKAISHADIEEEVANWRAKPVFAVGKQTQLMLQEIGFADVKGSDSGRGEILANQIVMYNCENGNNLSWLFLCGNIRSDAIPSTLSEANITCEQLCVYETISVVPETSDLLETIHSLGTTEPWIAFFSPSGVRMICEWVELTINESSADSQSTAYSVAQWIKNSKKIAIGPTTASGFQEFGWYVHQVAESPTPEALVQAIENSLD